MNYITITYTVDFELSFNQKYVWTKCKKCFNKKTGREIRQRIKNGSIGYYIDGKFYTTKNLRKQLIKPTNKIKWK